MTVFCKRFSKEEWRGERLEVEGEYRCYMIWWWIAIMLHSSKRLRKVCRGDTTERYPAPGVYSRRLEKKKKKKKTAERRGFVDVAVLLNVSVSVVACDPAWAGKVEADSNSLGARLVARPLSESGCRDHCAYDLPGCVAVDIDKNQRPYPACWTHDNAANLDKVYLTRGVEQHRLNDTYPDCRVSTTGEQGRGYRGVRGVIWPPPPKIHMRVKHGILTPQIFWKHIFWYTPTRNLHLNYIIFWN